MEHKETKLQTTAKEQSTIGRKITSGLFYLKSRNRKHSEGLAAMCTGVIMSSSARTALSPPPAESGSHPREPAKVPALLLSAAQSCPAAPSTVVLPLL